MKNSNMQTSIIKDVYIYIYMEYIFPSKRVFKSKVKGIPYKHIYIMLLFLIWWRPFIPSRNLDDVFTYNHIWL